MFDEFILRAALAGIGLALAAGPLGCFVVWRRMAYFGDATAHASILGVALALAFDVSIYAGTVLVALAMAMTVSSLARRGHVMDTTLGVLAHGALALGLVGISFVPAVRVDLSAYLFGDILAVDWSDVAMIWTGSALVLALLWWRWSPLLLATLNEDLAYSTGIRPARERLALTLALAMVVALSIKVVGALLISAILIIPAAAARSLSQTPEGMAGIAVLTGIASVAAGLGGSLRFDTPAGPSIIVAAGAFFVASTLLNRVVARG